MDQHIQDFPVISEWLKQQPLSILQLDAADRIVLFIADERDAIQKKTFTKWVNKHLIKRYTCLHVCTENCSLDCDEVTKGVVDLFEDLRDGHNLISLLEVLSGEILPRERGRMRVHMLQNIQICLNFLKRRKIKLVNIRPDDIVDGNPKLTLGLIWTIILHFQLSDIVLHDDTQSFKEALLRWAQKTTEGYPGVRVTDFTQSWRDGLAFNAILHRNRPDLLDYRSCRGRTARVNLENAFHIADKDLGVTRLLDPEDVDTPNPDEKSLITYISSLYELFPEPPEHNPLLDLERIRRIDEYKELASRLCVWMRESISRLRERNFPNTLQELKILQTENNRFRTEEIPPKLHDKQRLASSYKDILKMVRALPGGHHRIEEEYKIENIEHQWNKLITAHQERDHAITEEVNRLEKLHRLAEKLLRDIKQCDVRLDDIERQIIEEEKRVQRLHPLETKFNVEKIEAELKQEEERIKSMFKDVQALREGRYHKATELHNRVQQLHQRWADMKLDFQTRVVQALADRRAEALKKPLTEEELIASNPSFKFLHECIVWVHEKLKKLETLDYGNDLQSVKERLDQQKTEHRSIDQFQTKVEQCDRQKQQFKGEEYEVYTRMLNRLHKGYSELLVMSNKRLSDLDTLLDFVQSASNELKWLADKEEVEVSRDWSTKSINLVEVEQYHRQLISDMERREHQFNVIQDRGESLIRQRHPATKCIEGLMARMQSQWSWLLQLINCLETHSKNAADYHQFYNEARECDQWITKTEDKLNTTYSKQNFSIEEGEQLLKEMVRLKEDITRFGSVVSDLVVKSKDVVPLKQRKAALPRPIKVRSVCLIKQGSATITKNESVTLHDNSQRSKWRVISSSGSEINAPGVCFVIPPPDQEAIDTANELKKRYEALVVLWARKQHKLRQNMIFATLKIVKGWDYPTYCAMDPNQRDSIIRALEDDIDKLCREGPPDDPNSKRLRDEMDALKKKFEEFDARRRAEDEEKSNKALTKKYTDVADSLLEKLLEKEKILVQRTNNPIPRDRETLESLVIEHKEWERDVKSYETDIQRAKELFHNIPQKSHTVQRNYDEIIETWNRIWTLSQLYIERLKAVETVLLDIENATQVISKIEVQLASGDDMPADEVALRRVHNELIDSQNDIQRNKKTFDELNTSANKVRRIVERTRPKAVTHSDVNRIEDDIKNLFKRWDNCGTTVIERLRSCEACADLLRTYKKRIDSDRSWLSQINAKVNTLLTRPDLDTTAKIYESLVERKPSIEDTNAAGGRFIREAKIYDLKIKSHRESLEDSHPSLDASAKRSRRTPGVDIVAQELDQLNKDYSDLLETVSQLLNQLKEDDAKRLITKISFKTYRSDLGFAVNQTSNQMELNNDFNTSMTTTSNQHFGQISQSEPLTNIISAKTCKTTSSLVLKSSKLDSKTKKSIEIEQKLTQLIPSDQFDKHSKGETQALTFSQIKSSRRQKSESTETDEILHKSDTPSPKKAKSASDIVRESMKSKRVSNRVESTFDRKSRSQTKHISVELSSSSEIVTKSDKSESSSPERMSYSSSSSPIRSRVSSKESVSHKSEYKSDSDSKSYSSQRSSPEKETTINEETSSITHSMTSISKGMTSKSKIKTSTFEERESKEFLKSKRTDGMDSDQSLRSEDDIYKKSLSTTDQEIKYSEKIDLSDKMSEKSDSKRKTDSKGISSDQLSSETFMERKIETNVLKSDTGMTSESIITESTSAHTQHTQLLLLPPEGWPLKDAINQNLMDSDSGLFAIPGTDRLVSFEETIRLEIIDPNSAVVVDPQTNRKISLLRSFEKGILDSTGNYLKSKTVRKKIPMKEAIASKRIQFQETKKTSDKSDPTTNKILRITTTDGEPDKLDVIINPTFNERSLSDIPVSTTSLISNLLTSKDISTPIETDSNQYTISGAFNSLYDKESGLFKQPLTGELVSFETLIDKGFIDLDAVIYNTIDGSTKTTRDAIKEGEIDSKTGTLIDSKTNKSISLTEATRMGLISVVGAPILTPKSISGKISGKSSDEEKTVPKKSSRDKSKSSSPERISYSPSSSPIRSRVSSKESHKSEDKSNSDSKSQTISPQRETTDTNMTSLSSHSLTPQYTSTPIEIDSNQYTISDAFNSLYDKESGLFKQPLTGELVSFETLIDKGFIDLDAVIYNTIDGSTKTTRDAIKEGKIDSKTGTLIDSKTNKSIPLTDATRMGLISVMGVPILESESISGEDIQTNSPDMEISVNEKTSKPLRGSPILATQSISGDINQMSSPETEKTVPQKRRDKSKSSSPERLSYSRSTSPIRSSVSSKESVLPKSDHKSDSDSKSYSPQKSSPEKEMAINKISSVPHSLTPQEISAPIETDSNKYTISDAFSSLYDKNSGHFKEPQTGELVSFETLIDKGFIDLDALIYNTIDGSTKTTRDAIKDGTINYKTGSFFDSKTDKSIPLTEATHMGLIAVKGAPKLYAQSICVEMSQKYSPEKETTLYEKRSSPNRLRVPSKESVSPKSEHKTDSNSKSYSPESSSPEKETAINEITSLISHSLPSKQISTPIETDSNQYTISDAFNSLYDKESGLFKQPLTGELVSFETLIDKGFIDLDAVIYNTIDGSTKTTRDAIKEGKIDSKTGTLIDSKTNKSIPLTEATHMGLISVVAPILTPKSISGKISGKSSDEEKTVPKKKSSRDKSESSSPERMSYSPSSSPIRSRVSSKESHKSEDKSNSDSKSQTISPQRETTDTKMTSLSSHSLTPQYTSTPIEIDSNQYTISGAFNSLYDKESGLFKQPLTGELVSFETLIDKGFIDLDAVIYNTIDGSTKTTRDAIKEGKIDSKTGTLIDSKTNKSIPLTDATRMGLISVMGAPILASESISGGGGQKSSPEKEISVNEMTSKPHSLTSQEISTQIETDAVSIIIRGAVRQKTSESKTSQTEGSPPMPEKRASAASIKSQTEVNKQDKSTSTVVSTSEASKFQDALNAALKWLSDTEEEVANQKPISADYKVVKAQLQEQKLLKKLILDKEHSIQSLVSMGREIIKNMDSSERVPIERQVNDISRRFDKLMTDCNTRMDALEQTLPIARTFAEKLIPLQDWLESSERKLSSLSYQIPTDQERIRKRISEHRSLHQDIISHKRDFEELTEIAQNLMSLVGDDEAQVVVEKLQGVTDRYAKLVEDSIRLGQLLNESHEELGSFVLSFEDILAWIQEMESRLNRFRVLSVFVDKLREQVDELTEMSEEIHSHENKVSDIVRSGQEIMKHSSGGDSIFIREKLDALQSRFSELTHRTSDKLMQAKEALPIAQNFHSAHNNLNAWMDDAERELKNLGSLNLSAQEKIIKKLEQQITENRTLLETINHLGPQLGQISPGQGAATIEGYVTRASRRFNAICEQIQRKAERIELSKQRNNEVITDIDELLDWFRDAERQLLEAEPITPNPEALAILLKETKALYDDINSQKGRVRDVITNAKKLMRESSDEDLAHIRDKAEDLKELANHVSQLCRDRLNALEQALPLAEHFFEAHSELTQFLDEAESEAQMLGKPAIHAPQIRRQQEATKSLLQSVAEHKPLVDKLNKTGAALMRLIFEDDARQVQKLIDSDNDRYNRLRNLLREQQNALEAALQATSQFVDKLDGMLNALNNTADQLRNAEPIAAHPDRIQEQIIDNNAIINDLDKRAGAVDAIKAAARDVINKAGKSDEPAIKDIKNKLNKLNDLWDEVQKNSKNRGRSLDDALKVAEKFWNELNNVMKAIRELQDTLNNQEPPAAEPNEIKEQQNHLKDIKHDMDQTKPEVERTKQTGRNLMQLCGEPDKPEVKKHIEDLDNAWDNVTSLYAKREQNLIDAMEKAMNFHEMLKNLMEFLDNAKRKFDGLGPIAADIDAVKRQIRELKEFQNEVNPHMVEIEALNRQAHELLEDVSPNQARSIRGPVEEINRRWDDLLKNIVDRQTDLDNALLRLGQFQHALNEFLSWITKTERTLDDMRPVFGDPPVIEVELAKHKVLMNDIHAHQTSLDTLNIAGKQMMASERGTESARTTQSKLNDLNSRWEQLLDKAHQRQRELEAALKEAQSFNQEIQDLLIWLNDVDQQLSSSKPVGGLPETAREQLNRFMELFAELESSRTKVESVLKQGEDYLRRSTEGAATNLQHNLKTLRQRWDNVLSRANDRKIKLEIALREATEFHEALQEFVDWLTSSEKYLSNLQPVSRVVDNVLQQIEEHKHFQKDIGAHRETMLNLDKKGTHLKYFSQKQDVILIKNLLVSVQHRWERVVSKAAERTRALDHGYKEAKEFNDAWSDLISWLEDAEKTLDSIQQMGNNPEFIKQMLSRHKEFQRSLGAKQSIYDSTIKMGRTLKEKAPKPDISILQEMLDELKNKWNSVCNKSVDRQRKLEEALLYSGQFKDAIQALIDWLDKAKRELDIDLPVYGDLDTVTALVDQHKAFQEDFKSRAKNLQSVRKTASDLLQTATAEDSRHIKEQMNILDNKWDEVSRLSEQKQKKLEDALRQAEQLHKSVHMLLEWLSDAEMKLRFAGPLPEDEATTRQQIAEHERFMREMSSQEKNKDSTISLAQEILQKCHPDATPVIRHWITIIQSRWEEVSAWAQQREQRLQDHLRSLRNIMDLLEELLAWLIGAEASLLAAEALPLPDDVLSLERLIEEHQRFIDDMIRREPDVEKVAKAFSTKRTTREQISKSIEKGRTRGLPPRTSTPTRGHVEPDIKHPRARELLEKWRVVWKLAMDRMKRLQDKLNYNRELDRMRNFDFDEWRRRFLGWMNNKKARIMDFFRKIDTDNDGKVTKSEFIEGFLASKFPTSRLEMDRVADIFDRNNDGYIDQKEYLDTLRPDRDQPKTEAEIIQDEVQRQVSKCTCLVRYKVFQVGEGRYRFGESQKLRLVRILRSTVMVRVGGGWVSLDEFLIKNDPCRAKGRTNVELREQFILADGVSQSMTPFKSKSPIKSDGTISTTGPITKIREKSERSVPMTHQHHYRYGNSTSDYSFSDQHDSSGASKGRPRSRLTIGSGSKPNSTPGSRQSSRPASRASSDMSVESLEGYQQRRTTSTTRSKLSFGTQSRTNGTNGTRERWK